MIRVPATSSVHNSITASDGNRVRKDKNGGMAICLFKVSNSKYEGSGNFLVVTTDFAFHTEKNGDLHGSFIQIWRRDGDGYTIYHDEYQMF
ncbi:hypothetical protein OESDEN_03032 [Oesophagostomum dentatum]|uniref:DUF4440 domain-containing protein n=1 Tax=Oesophagostomum dentatum TaxID=61180 RepID=A0A0B1TIB4_OESDE|nr:hypothetical protein OESDEN_03032 [Oesophagostomum dentatum]